MTIKKQERFFKIEEKDNCDIIWNGFPVERTGGKKLMINEEFYNISADLQNVFTNTSNIPLKNLTDNDSDIYRNNLESLDFNNYKAIRVETKPATYK